MPELTRHEIRKIEHRLAAADIHDSSLTIDLLDHICCMIEERVEQGLAMARAEEEVFKEMGEVQLKAIEAETKKLTQNKYTMKKRTKIVGIVALVLIAAGFTMKMLHVPGAGITWSVGILTAAFGFLLFLFLDRFSYTKTSGGKLISIMGFLGSTSFVLGFGFKLMRQPGSHYMIFIGGVLLLIYFIISNALKTNTELS